jgi:hypothetical protein
MTQATAETEYYKAVITGDLAHIKWLHNKYPTVDKSSKAVAELALAWQQYEIFDYLTHGDKEITFRGCNPMASMEHLKRSVGNLHVDEYFLETIFGQGDSSIDNPLILELPNTIEYMKTELEGTIEHCVSENLVNVLYALLHKAQYRRQILDMECIREYLTCSYHEAQVLDNLICTMLCDFFGVESAVWMGCEYKDCKRKATIDGKWCHIHNLSEAK